LKLYKLTDKDGYTRRDASNETLWGPNITHRATGTGGLCTNGVIHAYEHPLIAAFMNPIHASFGNPILWIAEGEITRREGQLKCGCRELTAVKKTRLPKITQEQRIRISIYCALSQFKDPAFETWAENWLSGKDRTETAAWAAARAAEAEATWAEATWATWAARAEAWAARAAAWAAWTAAWAAWAAEATWAAEAEAWAAEAEAWAAEAEAWAARAARAADFDLLSIIRRVVEKGE
jgi:hypothetical protein